jgi:phosphate starvation-inducible membrane PsiE
MKIPLVQHFVVAFILSVVIAICLFLLFPRWWDVVGQVLVLFAIFGFVGLLWMLFEGKTPQKSVFLVD